MDMDEMFKRRECLTRMPSKAGNKQGKNTGNERSARKTHEIKIRKNNKSISQKLSLPNREIAIGNYRKQRWTRGVKQARRGNKLQVQVQ